MVTLALAVIVKDGQATIGKMLDSIRGRGFDRVAICDTGSSDRTREIVAEHIRTRDGSLPTEVSAWVTAKPLERNDETITAVVEDQDRCTWILGQFGWCDDFAAARNASFRMAQSTSKQLPDDNLWVMYLDADDTVEYRGPKVDGRDAHWDFKTGSLNPIAKNHPHVNVVALNYAYLENIARQEVPRIYKMSAGWKWKDRIHEFCQPSGQRDIAKNVDIFVVHNTSHEAQLRSFERNNKIIERALTEDMTVEERARMLYHYATSARLVGGSVQSDSQLRQVEEMLPHSTFWLYARRERVIHAVLHERSEQSADPSSDPVLLRALDLAGGITSKMPGIRDGFEYAGWVHTLRRDFPQAATAFDFAKNLPTIALMSIEDVWLTEGCFPMARALAYAMVDRVQDAVNASNELNPALRQHECVFDLFVESNRIIMKKMALSSLKTHSDMLIWDTQPTHALQTLVKPPACIQDIPAVAEMRRALERKILHLRSYEDYAQHYASIPDETYHSAEGPMNRMVLNCERTLQLLEYASTLEKDGPPIHFLTIGSQDAIIEDELLSLNERFHVTLVDVAPQAGKPTAELARRYPGRVHRYVMGTDKTIPNDSSLRHYDWGPDVFDVVSCFEVIEHVPNDDTCVHQLLLRLKKDGKLFISTPVADRWVEPYLTQGPNAPPWYGHVRAHTAKSLWALLRMHNLTGDIVEGRDGTYVFQGQRDTRPKLDSNHHVEILVASTPTPFDAISPEDGFLGGSEEAVVRLSRALFRAGASVTVYAPELRRGGGRLCVHDGVLWMTPDEFDAGAKRGEGDCVLFWRTPQGIDAYQKYTKQNGDAENFAGYKKFLWLHDLSYGATPEQYAVADKILTLSESHRKCLIEEDHAPKEKMVNFPNGIDADDFPAPNEEERHEFKVIYASSPDRGLERLLEMWPRVKEAVPLAELDIFYDWSLAKKMKPDLIEKLVDVVESLKDNGVKHHGGVAQPILHEAFRRASIWSYPHEGKTETHCITALKALAAGCYAVCTDAGALAETVQVGEIVKEGEWEVFEKRLIEVLQNPPSLDRRALAHAYALTQTWDTRAKQLLAMCGAEDDA